MENCKNAGNQTPGLELNATQVSHRIADIKLFTGDHRLHVPVTRCEPAKQRYESYKNVDSLAEILSHVLMG